MMLLANGALRSFFLLLVLILIIHETLVSSLDPINSKALPNSSSSTDISLGSTLSANAANSWISPSGRFSFGFYPEGEGYSLGIRLIVNPSTTMEVWRARRDLNPFSRDAFLNFTADGFFIVLGRGKKTYGLFIFNYLASSAAMLDNGNFVVYTLNSTIASYSVLTRGSVPCSRRGTSYYNCPGNSGNPYTKISLNSTAYRATNSSNIIWRSFDYPSDTILGSQSLPCDSNLTTFSTATAVQNLLTMQCDGNLVLYSFDSGAKTLDPGTETWSSGTSGENYRSLSLDRDGRLYLTSLSGNQKDLSVYKSQNVNSNMIYAARLDSDGIFLLYEVNLDDNSSVVVNDIPYYKNGCQAKDICGVDSFCLIANDKPDCRCLPGFDYINKSARAAGCHRSLVLPGCVNGSGAGNLSMNPVENIVGLDNLAYAVISATGNDQCSSYCGDDCNCYAAFFREQRCFKLKVPLTGGWQDPQDPGVAFVKISVGPGASVVSSGLKKREVRVVAIVVSAVIAGVICLAVIASSGGAYWFLIGRFREQWKKWEIALTEEIVPRYFSYEELVKVPGTTRRELGKGGHGTVFSVELPVNGISKTVAVKWLHGGVAEAEKDFQMEMSLIGRARHRNLVRLLGFCHDGLNRLLVYEFMPRGSLADHIFESKSRRPNWARLVGILLGAARGIQYLHHDCETKIIHRDIKPENILIADDWTAKISDFGLAKLMTASQTKVATRTLAAGTEGYVAPECELQDDRTGAVMLTEKADVYSYGVVVLETVCGQRNREAKLCESVRALHDAGEVGMLLDREEAEAIWELERVVKIGILCVQRDPEARPSMEEVVMLLEGVMDVPNPPPLSVSWQLL